MTGPANTRSFSPAAKVFGRLIDLSNNDIYVFEWNPAEIDEKVNVNYTRQKIPGLSHSRTQFLNTENREFTFSLTIDGLAHGGADVVEKARLFFLSLCFPRASKKLDGAGPPKVLFMIPGVISSKGFIDDVTIKHVLFYDNMQTRRFEASFKFVEELDRRTTSLEIRRNVFGNKLTPQHIDLRNVSRPFRLV
jgi:hypothetical protein